MRTVKKLINNFSKNCLNRIFAFIILEIFMLTYVLMGSGAVTVINKDKKNDTVSIVKLLKDRAFDALNTSIEKDGVMPIVLSCAVDKDNNLIKMSWTSDNANESYFVFKRAAGSKQYELISSSSGLTKNFYFEKYGNQKIKKLLINIWFLEKAVQAVFSSLPNQKVLKIRIIRI